MVEFIVLALTVAIISVSFVTREAVIASMLLIFWLPVLVAGVYDLPNTGRWSDLILWSPVTALFFAPFILVGRRVMRK